MTIDIFSHGVHIIDLPYSQPWIILFRDISYEFFFLLFESSSNHFFAFFGHKMGQNFAETNKRIIPQERA